jgi:hypothetical protein
MVRFKQASAAGTLKAAWLRNPFAVYFLLRAKAL